MTEAKLSAVVVAYRSAADLPASLGALAGVDSVTEVVVVDHGDDDSASVAAGFGATVLRDQTNPGYGAGQNHGVAATSAPYLLLLNPDAVVDPDGIAEGLAYLDANPKVAAVQGIIHNRVTGQPERSQGVELRPVHLFGRALGARRLLRWNAVRRISRRIGVLSDHVERAPDAPKPVESVAATALLIRRSAFEEIGGFDESFFLYGEDLDLCRRLRGAGWTLVALPLSWAEHTSGASSAGWWHRELVWWEGTLRFAARWWSPPAWTAGCAAVALRIPLMVLARPRQAGQVVRRLLQMPYRLRRAAR